MNSERTLLEELRRFVHDHAKIHRKKAAESGAFVSIRKILNTSFDPENVDITFADEEDVVALALNAGRATGMYIENYGDFDWFKQKALDNIHFNITILFPEVLLKNSENKKHLIKDLFVRIKLSAEGVMLEGSDGKYLWGTRSSFTPEEIIAGYGHSHLRKIQFNFLNFEGFCTGSGDINSIMERMADRFDEIVFTQFCHCLKVYLSWESLEGVPYVKIQTIIGEARRTVDMDFPEVDVAAIFAFWTEKIRHIDQEVLRPFFKIGIEDGRFDISLSPSGASYLIGQMMQVPLLKHHKYFAVKISKGRLAPLSEETANLNNVNLEKTVLVFRHKEIKFQLLNSNTTLDVSTVFLSPRITEGFRRIFTDKFNAGFVRASALIPQCPSLNPQPLP